jgi:hypothetical protein
MRLTTESEDLIFFATNDTKETAQKAPEARHAKIDIASNGACSAPYENLRALRDLLRGEKSELCGLRVAFIFG